jgi:hypothetical protein
MAKDKVSFNPKQVGKKLLALLSARPGEVVEKRYGLTAGGKRFTLEAIGQKYGITRERVRQIENHSLGVIQKSPVFKGLEPMFSELEKLMVSYGGIVHEQEFLDAIGRDPVVQNYIHFLLVLGDAFTKIKEDEDFHTRWTVNQELASKVHESLRQVCAMLEDEELMTEDEIVHHFISHLKRVFPEDTSRDLARRWLSLAKKIQSNPLGEWGISHSPKVRMRGIKDYAYLALRQRGEPMHFNEVAAVITSLFGKQAHPATCHNELIKDPRFVLVGRGLYGLAEWGYTKGMVREVIRNILSSSGPLPKDEIVRRVLKERRVKTNTVLVNLHNRKFFQRNQDGLYQSA